MTVAELNAALFGTSDARAIATPRLIQQMLDSGDGISDLVFSPGRPPQVERFGELVTGADRRAADARAEDTAGHRPRSDSRQRDGTAHAERHRLDRPVVRAARSLPLPRQRLPPARHVRDRDAHDRAEDSVDPGARPAAGDRRLRDAEERHRARDRPDRIGQVVDARRDHRPDQHQPRRSHPDHRGSDRVPAQAQEGHRPPARAAHRHADVRAGAAERRCARRRR